MKKLTITLISLALTILLFGCVNNNETNDTNLEINEIGLNTNDNYEEEVIEEKETENPITDDIDNDIIEDKTVLVTTNNEEDTTEIINEENYLVINDELTEDQRKFINILNYMTVLTQKVNAAKGDQLFLESAYTILKNDIYPNSVDIKTQAQITNLMDTINSYRMINVKKERLEYIYEQKKAQALREAIPNPIGLLSAIQSGSMLKTAASYLYMTIDSAFKYKTAMSQADKQFIEDGWKLDDEQTQELHKSTTSTLNYMFNMVRDYDLPGDYALNEEAINDFIKWANKPDSQLVNKIEWFKSHEIDYENYGPYWLELAEDYYAAEDFEKCLESIEKYKSISTRIVRKDNDFATILPKAIISAKETMDDDNYFKYAYDSCEYILKNTKDADWSTRYFVAQIYLDLYTIDNNDEYLEKARTIALQNVINLIDEQKNLNSKYLEPVKKETTPKDATDKEKKDIKTYNKIIENERKTALPPISEALYLNCDLLYALTKELNLPQDEMKKIDTILHENGDSIFLTKTIDNKFWFNNPFDTVSANNINISYKKGEVQISADYVSDKSKIIVSVYDGKDITIFDDWVVDKVERPKDSSNVADFTVIFKSESSENYKYKDGDQITVKVLSHNGELDYLNFDFTVKTKKNLYVFESLSFERVIND